MEKDETKSALNFMPTNRTISALRTAAKKCQGCHLYKNAKQTVFGEGGNHAELMIVGEIPGEKEDDLGRKTLSSNRYSRSINI